MISLRSVSVYAVLLTFAAAVDKRARVIKEPLRQASALSKLEGVASSFLVNPTSASVLGADASKLYGPLLMRTDLFVAEGVDLVEKLRLQLGVKERVDAIRHFFKYNQPEIAEVTNSHDMFQFIAGLGKHKTALLTVMAPLRDLLDEYIVNRARYPIYDYLPTGLRDEYLKYFTPVDKDDFPVRVGTPGVLAFLPRCGEMYEELFGADQPLLGNLIVLKGIGNYPSRIVNLIDGTSTDLNREFDGIVFVVETREVITRRRNGGPHERWVGRSRQVSQNPHPVEGLTWHGYFSRHGETAVLSKPEYFNLLDMDDVLSEMDEDIEELMEKGDLTPQQEALVKYWGHLERGEVAECSATLPDLGMDMTFIKPADVELLDSTAYARIEGILDYMKESVSEIIADGSVSGRIYQPID